MTGQPSTPIPDDIRRFTLNSIDPVPALEPLLLMRRDPDCEWSLAAALYMEPRRMEPRRTGPSDACRLRGSE